MPDSEEAEGFQKTLTGFNNLNSVCEREVKLDDLHLRKSKNCRLENGVEEEKNMWEDKLGSHGRISDPS